MQTLDVPTIRSQFSGLSRTLSDQPVVFFDGPAGSQVPDRVSAAVVNYLTRTNANHGGPFATSCESDQILDEAHRVVADFLGTSHSECVVFGPNMTTLTFALSRAVGRTFQPDDEVIVSRLDHDANVTPWVSAAAEAGAVVKHINLCGDEGRLDLDDFEAKLSERTRLVAVGYASNATGTINPVQHITRRAHQQGALVFIDAVHLAPHQLIDVDSLGCDFLACSAYKFFGPHVGVLWGKPELLASLHPDKLRPAAESLPGKWMTGTPNHEGIAGTAEAIAYLASLGHANSDVASTRCSAAGGSTGRRLASTRGTDRTMSLESPSSLRVALQAAYQRITAHERELVNNLIQGLGTLADVQIWGITNPRCFQERVPTVSFTLEGHTPTEIAQYLAQRGIFVWAGNHYALPFTEAMGLEPEGTVRVGLLHYNTHEEIERLLVAMHELRQS